MNKTQHLYTHTYAQSERCVIDLTLSENPLGCSETVKPAIQKGLNDLHRYPHHEEPLIQALAKHHGVSPRQILIGAGANQLLEDVFRILACQKGVLTSIAVFPEPLAYIETLGGYSVTIPLKEGFHVDIDTLLKEITAEIGLIYLCNPNNPTGITTPTKEILSLTKQTQLPVVVSEAGMDFVGRSLIHKNMPSNLLVIRSFSKAYGLAGLRIGYVVAHAEMIARLKRSLSAFRVNALALKAAIAVLQDQEHLRFSIQYLLKQKQILMDEMQKFGFEVVPSEGQTFIAQVPQHFKNATDFCEKAKKHGVSVVDCSLYAGLERYIRIAPQLQEVNQRFLSILKTIVLKEEVR
ncbi:MAG: histidinol-phosphate aminotransferase family protein [Gammaproteobacteria bacterium]|nr:histidinol-phosphate aminotransferase family protein [Gammaproteobacteria bacterium]